MRNVLRGTIAAAAVMMFIGGAQAADLMDTPTGYWNGFYIGGQAGYFETTVDIPGPVDFEAGDGIAIGGYAGYNMQLNSNFVIGIEGDYNFSVGGTPAPGVAPFFEVDAFGSIRARAGYAIDATLLFVTAGVGFANLEGPFGAPLPPNVDDVAVGFAVGGGVEHFLTQSISMKAEYIYMGFDDVFVPGSNFDLDVHSIRGGVAFHF